MPLTGISNRGLILIAVLVALLWGCLLAERLIVRQASQETEVLLRSAERVRPASTEVRPVTRSRPPRSHLLFT